MRKRLPIILGLVLLAAGGLWRAHWVADASTPPAAASGKRPTPVQVAAARLMDAPVFRHGLGAVQPLNLVTVRSRVDGEVMQVAFTEGQTVHAGDLLVQIDPRPYKAALDQAKAKQQQDEAQHANAERDLARYQQLAQSNFASRQQLDSQRATVAQLEAQIAGDAAAVESAQLQLDYSTIRAPITGRAGFRLVDKGNLVRATDATGVVTLTQLDPITAVFTLPERHFAIVSAAMKKGVVPAKAFGPDGRELARGELTVLNSQIDQASGTFKAKATFANADGALWPGQSVTVRILVDTLRGVVTIPEDGLQRGADSAFVFVVNDDSVAERRAVKVRRQADGLVVIDDGVNPGERVVTAGAARVEQGTAVSASEATVAPLAQATQKPGDTQ
ncbi:MAG TPA: efflux RND transporter periplasmic adaptor subunit [Hansschlegelia sp.]